MNKVEWAVGDQYSLVDPFLLIFYRWGNRMGIPMRNTYKSWSRHTLRLVERPAVRRALNAEGISVWE
jgi:glutathione S-transferase